ncbi:MAG: TetR/AcrR family transcriptional regulator [Ignavibacteria bacterium]|nr:MAG: TetR/AcrR family transcriptional regulator [Ignavibacteria bacterium]
MRIKDEIKQEAVIAATVKLVNEIGFVNSSVAKIAKEAGVSPATIYIYYKNKEDLIVSTYLDIKKQLSNAMLKGFDSSMPIRDTLEKIWSNAFVFFKNNQDLFNFVEQFEYSPYHDLVDKSEINQLFDPIMQILTEGINQKIIKNVDFELLSAFIFFPILTLANKRICKNFVMSEENIAKAFQLAWDAIKL